MRCRLTVLTMPAVMPPTMATIGTENTISGTRKLSSNMATFGSFPGFGAIRSRTASLVYVP